MTRQRPYAREGAAARWIAACLLVVCGALSVQEAGANGNGGRPQVRDTAYGETLYAFYQKQYFAAISRLLVARERRELPRQANDGELLLGGLYVQYGLPDAASDIFASLPPGDEAQASRVWLALAELNYRRERFPEALAIIESRFPRETSPEDAVMIAVKSLMRLGRYAEATDWLRGNVSKRPEARYLRFNLAVAQVAQGNWDAGGSALEELLALPAEDDEMRALRDRVALALAATRLQQGLPAPAVKALADARVNGPYSSEALLIYGIAALRNAEPAKATGALVTLTKRSPHTQAVQEGLVTLAQAYEARHDEKRALKSYRSALKHLQGELEYLKEQSAAIESGAWFAALESRAGDIALRDDRAGLADADVLGMPLHYRQFAGNRFVLTFTQYVEISVLARLAADWQDRVPVLAWLVESREQRHRRVVAEAGELLAATPLAPLAQRQVQLAQDVEVAIAADAPDVMASAARQQQRAMLRGVDTRMSRWPARDWSRQQQRLALLNGVLQWEIAREQPAQAWGLKRAVRDNARLVEQAGQRRAAVERAMARQQASVDGWLPSLARDGETLQRLAIQSTELRAKLRRQMEDDARDTIQANRERIVQLAADAYYGIAQIEHGRWREGRERRREREAAKTLRREEASAASPPAEASADDRPLTAPQGAEAFGADTGARSSE